MPIDVILSVAFLMAIIGLTPGPLSLMVFAYGSQIGLRQALPFVVGGSLGYALLVMLCFVSLAGALQTQPGLVVPAKVLSALILVWFSWKIATSGAVTTMRPISRGALVLEGCMLQAVNPKAWAAGIALATSAIDSAASGAMVDVEPVRDAGVVGVVVFAVIFSALLVWAASGQGLSRFLACDVRRRYFNFGMAGALLAVGLPSVFF